MMLKSLTIVSNVESCADTTDLQQISSLLLCMSIHAKPINHAKHLMLARGSMAHLLTNVVEDKHFHTRDIQHERDDMDVAAHTGIWIIHAGDTGNMIASRFGISFAQIAALNPSVNWTNLQIGQIVTVPCGEDGDGPVSTYIVKGGDTGDKISASYGISFAQLAAVNPGVNWYNLQIGQVLVVPSGTT